MQEKQARIYARFSSTNQREESIEGQLRECNDFAKKHGYVVTGEYADRAISGKGVENRTAFRSMVKDAERGLFDVLIVYKLDRFARNRYDAAVYKHRLAKAGVQVVSAMEHIPDGAEGIILESMLDGFAEYYSANLAENVRRGAKETALDGRFNGGQVPYGYAIEDGRYVLDEARSCVVREVFERLAAGETYKAIYDSLNARGLRTLKGKPFTRGSICSMIKQEKYRGEFVYNVSDGDVVSLPDAVPAIVSDELWDAVQARCEKSRHAPRVGKGKEKYALSGLIYCGVCGTSFHGFSSCPDGRKVYPYYRHNREHESERKCMGAILLKRDALEDAVFGEISERVLNSAVIDEITRRALELQAEDVNAETGALEAELAEVDASLANIYKAIESGILSSGLQARIDELEERHNALVAELNSCASSSSPQLSGEQISAWLRGFLGGDIHDAAFRERLADNFIQRVEIKNGAATIYLRYADEVCNVSFELVNCGLAKLQKAKCDDAFDFGNYAIAKRQNTKSEHGSLCITFLLP